MQDAAVFNLNNVKEAFGLASNPGGTDYLTGFDAFYKEEKPFKGNSLWFAQQSFQFTSGKDKL